MAATVEQLAPDSQVETTVAESTVCLRVPPSGTGMLPPSSTEETRAADADLGEWLRYAPREPLFLSRYRTKPQEGLDGLLSGSDGLALPKPPKKTRHRSSETNIAQVETTFSFRSMRKSCYACPSSISQLGHGFGVARTEVGNGLR